MADFPQVRCGTGGTLNDPLARTQEAAYPRRQGVPASDELQR